MTVDLQQELNHIVETRGRAYEYLLRKFAEGSGQSAGEFYTPREVAILISYILDPAQGQEIYDPCCGSAGLLIKCYLLFSGMNDIIFLTNYRVNSHYQLHKMANCSALFSSIWSSEGS